MARLKSMGALPINGQKDIDAEMKFKLDWRDWKVKLQFMDDTCFLFFSTSSCFVFWCSGSRKKTVVLLYFFFVSFVLFWKEKSSINFKFPCLWPNYPSRERDMLINDASYQQKEEHFFWITKHTKIFVLVFFCKKSLFLLNNIRRKHVLLAATSIGMFIWDKDHSLLKKTRAFSRNLKS